MLLGILLETKERMSISSGKSPLVKLTYYLKYSKKNIEK